MAKNGAGVSFGGTGLASVADWDCEAMTVPAAVPARGFPRGMPQILATAPPACDAGDAGDAGTEAGADSCAGAGADVGADVVATARADSESPSLTAEPVLRFLGRVSSTGDGREGRASVCVSGTARVRAGRENVGSK